MSALGTKGRLLGPALRTQPDRRLVSLAREGGEAAQSEIVRRYRAALVRYAGGIVGAAAAEDVVQDSLAKALPALGRSEEEVQLRPWLYAIVRNTALNHLRDAGPATEELDENFDGVEQPPQALERRERLGALVGGLRRLPGQQREALVKRELEGRSHEEIGADLGVSKGAARQLVFRARESLRVGFGGLVPMPLLRWLAEGASAGGGDAAVGVAAGAGGSALAAKAAIAVLATGAAVGGAVAIDHGVGGGRQGGPPAAEAAVRHRSADASGPLRSAAEKPTQSPAVSVPAGDDSSHRRGNDDDRGDHRRHDSGDERRGGEESDSSSGPGPGISGESGGEESGGPGDDGGGPGPSSDTGSTGSDSGRNRGSGKDSGSGDDKTRSHSGSSSGSSHSGSAGSDSSGSRSGKSGSTGDDSGGPNDEFRSSSGGSDGSSGGSKGPSGSDSSGGTDFSGSEPGQSSAPPPAPAPTPESSSTSGSGGPSSGSGDELSESSRDLSGGSVSQGSEDHD